MPFDQAVDSADGPDVWTMRAAIVEAGLGTMAEAQSLGPDDLLSLYLDVIGAGGGA